MTEDDLRRAICRVGELLWQRRMVAANDGNISVRLPGGRVLCTPTGVSKAMMDAAELPIVALASGEVLSGVRPSSEIKMHLRVYQEDPQVGAVVHAHPLHATVFAIAGEPIVNKMLPESIVALPEVPVASYATPSTQAVPDSVAPFVRSHGACLLENHGALTWGADLMAAYLQMERLEYTAELLHLVGAHGRVRELTGAQIAELQSVFGGPIA